MISIGSEQLCRNPPLWLKNKRLGLLSNQASTNRTFTHVRDSITTTFPGQLTTMFSPQHGFFSEKQDNMIESGNAVDRETGVRIFSLYGETRKPYFEMFAEVDVLLIDLIDVGTRVYTFIWTIVYCLQVAKDTGTKVLILDRPNPVGGHMIEGNVLEPEYQSFVGMCAIPMRHGLTIGELAMFCNQEMDIYADLDIIPMQGWKRNMFHEDTGFPWVFPSPNMPTPDTALVYPGQVIWEGTTLSEARGTTLPFEMFGAPYIEHEKVLGFSSKTPLPGCYLRPVAFEPTSGKYGGIACNGFQIHVTDPHCFLPYRTSLVLLQAMLLLYPDDFAYKQPPYEYEFEKLPMDLILGSKKVRNDLEDGKNILEMEASWTVKLAEFDKKRSAVFLY